MKDRIEELANRAYESGSIDTGPLYGSIHSAITDAVNEALELAARECEKEAKRLTEIGFYNESHTATVNAAAISREPPP